MWLMCLCCSLHEGNRLCVCVSVSVCVFTCVCTAVLVAVFDTEVNSIRFLMNSNHSYLCVCVCVCLCRCISHFMHVGVTDAVVSSELRSNSQPCTLVLFLFSLYSASQKYFSVYI